MANVQDAGTPASEPQAETGYAIIKQTKSRWWKVRDPSGELVCLTVYRRGAWEVVRRLSA